MEPVDAGGFGFAFWTLPNGIFGDFFRISGGPALTPAWPRPPALPPPPERSSGRAPRRRERRPQLPAPPPSLRLCSRPLLEAAANQRRARLPRSQWENGAGLSIKAQGLCPPTRGREPIGEGMEVSITAEAGKRESQWGCGAGCQSKPWREGCVSQ